MDRFNEFEKKKYEIFNKYADDADTARQELDKLAEEYKDLVSSADLKDNPDFIRNQIMQLASLEEAPTEYVVYKQEKIKDEQQKKFDDKYRIEVEILEGGKLPMKAHKTDAGFDLYATEDVTIHAGYVTKHPLNIKMKLPEGTYAQITSKSGLGSKGLLVYAGIIDESYRGIPHVICTCLIDSHFHSIRDKVTGLPCTAKTPAKIHIKKGQKLAQLIMYPYSSNYYMAEVEEVSEDTDRGTGGFGSSGE